MLDGCFKTTANGASAPSTTANHGKQEQQQDLGPPISPISPMETLCAICAIC
jgi:hypothetical protein